MLLSRMIKKSKKWQWYYQFKVVEINKTPNPEGYKYQIFTLFFSVEWGGEPRERVQGEG